MTWQQRLQQLGMSKAIILSQKPIDSMLKGEALSSLIMKTPLSNRASTLTDSISTFTKPIINKISNIINEMPSEIEDQNGWKLLLTNLTKFWSKYKKYLLPSFSVLFISILFSVFPFNDKDNLVTWFGIPTGISREATIIKDLHFFVLLAWFFIVVYLLLFLFYPLGKGFLLSHQLWLRFTNCKPHEVALSRVIWVVGYASLFGGLTGIWAIGTAIGNQVSLGELFWEAIAVSSYIIFAGGVITFSLTVLNFFKPVIDPLTSIVVSVFAWISFIFLLLVYGIVVFSHIQADWIKSFPLSAPILVLKDLEGYGKHLGITMLLGIILLGSSVAIPWLTHRNHLVKSSKQI